MGAAAALHAAGDGGLAARAAGELLHIKVVGLARLAPDIPVELAMATIGSITVLGALQAPPDIRAALRERIT